MNKQELLKVPAIKEEKEAVKNKKGPTESIELKLSFIRDPCFGKSSICLSADSEYLSEQDLKNMLAPSQFLFS